MGRLATSLLVGILWTVVVGGCTNTDHSTSPPTAEDAALVPSDRSKIDRDLLRLMSDSVTVTDVPFRRRQSGTPAYKVRIGTSDVEAIEMAGVAADSVREGTVWAYLTLPEIRGVAQLTAVTSVEADNDPRPR